MNTEGSTKFERYWERNTLSKSVQGLLQATRHIVNTVYMNTRHR